MKWLSLSMCVCVCVCKCVCVCVGVGVFDLLFDWNCRHSMTKLSAKWIKVSATSTSKLSAKQITVVTSWQTFTVYVRVREIHPLPLCFHSNFFIPVIEACCYLMWAGCVVIRCSHRTKNKKSFPAEMCSAILCAFSLVTVLIQKLCDSHCSLPAEVT